MKVLVLDQFSEPGGAQQALLDLLPAFREYGWDAVVGMPGEGGCFDRVRELGCEAVRIDCGPYRAGRKSVADVARFVTDTPRLARHIGRLASGADLVYLNGPRLLPATLRAQVKAPVLFHAHSYLAPGPTRRLAGYCLRRLEAQVVASCRFVGKQWKEHRVSVVYNGVAAAPAAESNRASSTGRGCRVGCIGRIAPEKGQLAFLAAAARIRCELSDCRFLIYGAPLFSAPGYEANVRSAARGLPVEFRGWTTDIYAALAELDLLLVPSAAHDATPRVILEAFAAGVPVVAFASGGIPELIADGRDGLLAHSVEEMARISVRMLTTDRESISRAARETWSRRFTLEIYRREVMSVLNRMAAPPATIAAPASTGP